jgi:hypothetical protein
MNKESWITTIREADTDMETMELLSSYLNEIDVARQLLREKGYGVTRTSILEQVKEVPIRED